MDQIIGESARIKYTFTGTPTIEKDPNYPRMQLTELIIDTPVPVAGERIWSDYPGPDSLYDSFEFVKDPVWYNLTDGTVCKYYANNPQVFEPGKQYALRGTVRGQKTTVKSGSLSMNVEWYFSDPFTLFDAGSSEQWNLIINGQWAKGADYVQGRNVAVESFTTKRVYEYQLEFEIVFPETPDRNEEEVIKKTGVWKKDSKGWWYQYSDGSYPKNCIAEIDGKNYGFNASGYMVTGWARFDDQWYYFESSGVIKTGWLSTGGKWYYLNPSNDGAMLAGGRRYVSADSTYYLFGSDGALKTGWYQTTGTEKWYYYDLNGEVTGWRTIGGKRYYFNPEKTTTYSRIPRIDGYMFSGKLKNIDGKTYVFKDSGEVVTGWYQTSGNWRYYGTDGARQYGWAKVGSTWYYLDPTSGIMQTGWQEIGNEKYYFNASGAMQTGWQKIENKWYYFASSGVMQKAKWVDTNYYMDADGVMVTNAYIKDGTKYYWVGKDGKYTKTYTEKDTAGYTIYDQVTGNIIQ